MITCPLCNKLVEVEENNSHAALYDDEPDDFICPTTIKHDGISHSHYFRQTLQGCYPRYVISAYPFLAAWVEGPNTIEVWELGKATFLFQGKGNHQEFVRIANKYNNLRAFA